MRVCREVLSLRLPFGQPPPSPEGGLEKNLSLRTSPLIWCGNPLRLTYPIHPTACKPNAFPRGEGAPAGGGRGMRALRVDTVRGKDFWMRYPLESVKRIPYPQFFVRVPLQSPKSVSKSRFVRQLPLGGSDLALRAATSRTCEGGCGALFVAPPCAAFFWSFSWRSKKRTITRLGSWRLPRRFAPRNDRMVDTASLFKS